MRLLMHVLSENKSLNIDNRKIGTLGIIAKLNEEYKEVVEALTIYSGKKSIKNLKNIIAETFDLIQICILILWRSNTEAKKFKEPDLVQEVNLQHKDKLIGRRWTIKTGIEIDVKE
ncbi:MAG: hypothetical protein GX275_02180 [Clostridiales bacterium]|nr:hypothetical protein [Clostridiales bacterium]